jgi:hypothetical protein
MNCQIQGLSVHAEQDGTGEPATLAQQSLRATNNGRRIRRKSVDECVSRRSYERLLDNRNRNCPLYPSGIRREAS